MSTVTALKSCVDYFTRRYCNARALMYFRHLQMKKKLNTAFSSQYLFSALVFCCTNILGYWGRDLSGRGLYVIACIVQCCCNSNVSYDLSEFSGLEHYISSFFVFNITSKEFVFIHESTYNFSTKTRPTRTKQKLISYGARTKPTK